MHPIFLDLVSPASLEREPKLWAEITQCVHALYGALDSQREALKEEYSAALVDATSAIAFKDWRRRVPMQHVLTPLSSAGSRSIRLGGRFNIGSMDPNRYPPFPALYLASDAETALVEVLGPNRSVYQLSALEESLQRPENFSLFAVQGEIEKCIDLTSRNVLAAYHGVVQQLRIPPELVRWFKSLGLGNPNVIASVERLTASILAPNWRASVALYTLPAPSQVFAGLCLEAGVEAIRYLSKRMETRRQCLAVFPSQFQHANSHVEIAGDTPAAVIRRLDRHTWRDLV
jgi:hypothetical protein